MKKPSKKFWRGLLIFIVVLGTMYGVAIYIPEFGIICPQFCVLS